MDPAPDTEMTDYSDGEEDDDTDTSMDGAAKATEVIRQRFDAAMSLCGFNNIVVDDRANLGWIWSLGKGSYDRDAFENGLITNVYKPLEPYLMSSPSTPSNAERRPRQTFLQQDTDAMTPATTADISINDRQQAVKRMKDFFDDAALSLTEAEGEALDASVGYWASLVLGKDPEEQAALKRELTSVLYESFATVGLDNALLQDDLDDKRTQWNGETLILKTKVNGLQSALTSANQQISALWSQIDSLARALESAREWEDEQSDQMDAATVVTRASADVTTRRLVFKASADLKNRKPAAAARWLSRLDSHLRVQASIDPLQEDFYRASLALLDPARRLRFIQQARTTTGNDRGSNDG